MEIELDEDDIVRYGDFRITASVDTSGFNELKIQTDKGVIIVRPKSDNMIIVETEL